MERRYTVREIDDLRQVCELRWLFGSSVINEGMLHSRNYKAEEKIVAVEEMVRTHMMAGHLSYDLYNEDKARMSSNDPHPQLREG